MVTRYNPFTGEYDIDPNSFAMSGGENSDDWENYNYGSGNFGGDDPLDLENLPELLPQADYSNEGRNYPTPESTQGPGGSPVNASTAWQNQPWAKNLPDWAKSALGFASSKGGMAGLLALLSYLDRQKGESYGGGATQAYAGPSKPLTPSTVPGKYGPLVTYAANGGLMQAYANGGKVQMEDGGFVMTKKAVDGAGGPRGIQQLVPGARMIGGPPDPTGRRDLTPAVIHGPNGTTPAKVSSGEAYVPKAAVDDQGGAQRMYEIMNKLQRSV